jgi:hypothetical protein
VITLEEIREVFTADGGALALQLHESIWEEIQEDLARGSTRNQVMSGNSSDFTISARRLSCTRLSSIFCP